MRKEMNYFTLSIIFFISSISCSIPFYYYWWNNHDVHISLLSGVIGFLFLSFYFFSLDPRYYKKLDESK